MTPQDDMLGAIICVCIIATAGAALIVMVTSRGR